MPGAAYLKFTLRANGNSVPPEQILDPDEERVVKVVAGQVKLEVILQNNFFFSAYSLFTEAHLKSLVYYRHAFSQAL